MAKCSVQGCNQQKVEALNGWCVRHYIANKSKQADSTVTGFYKLDSELKMQVGTSAYASIKALPSYIDSAGAYRSTGDYMHSALLARIGAAITQSPCVAVCLIGSMLIVGYNTGQFGQEQYQAMCGELEKAGQYGISVQSIFLVTEGKGRLIRLETKTATPIADNAIVDLRPRIHAEMRVLGVVDHLLQNGGLVTTGSESPLDTGYTGTHTFENTGFLNDDDSSGTIWIYVDKPCCAKCETVMRAYDGSNRGISIARTGYHESYDWDWRLPVPLRWLEQTIQYNVLKKAVGKG